MLNDRSNAVVAPMASTEFHFNTAEGIFNFIMAGNNMRSLSRIVKTMQSLYRKTGGPFHAEKI